MLKKSYNTRCTSLKINRKYLPFFVWLILRILLANIAPLNYIFLCMRRESSKWCGMVMYVLNNALLLNFLWHRNQQ